MAKKPKFTMRRKGFKMATMRVEVSISEEDYDFLQKYIAFQNKQDKAWGLEADNTFRREVSYAACRGISNLIEHAQEEMTAAEIEADEEEIVKRGKGG